MLNRKLKQLRETQARRANGENGFTLIELLVVIIIIGILASIAIPIFMNQQKTARDAATTSDVKNVATNVQTGLVKYPDAVFFGISDDSDINTLGEIAADDNGDGKLYIWVGNAEDDNEMFTVTVSKGTNITLVNDTNDGTFIVEGFNYNGKTYVDTAPLVYKSAAGGIR